MQDTKYTSEIASLKNQWRNHFWWQVFDQDVPLLGVPQKPYYTRHIMVHCDERAEHAERHVRKNLANKYTVVLDWTELVCAAERRHINGPWHAAGTCWIARLECFVRGREFAIESVRGVLDKVDWFDGKGSVGRRLQLLALAVVEEQDVLEEAMEHDGFLELGHQGVRLAVACGEVKLAYF